MTIKMKKYLGSLKSNNLEIIKATKIIVNSLKRGLIMCGTVEAQLKVIISPLNQPENLKGEKIARSISLTDKAL